MRELVDGPVSVHVGDALAVLRQLPSESVHCVVTSPPYLGLRDYGATGQLGLESSLDEYVCKLVEIFREVRRVLHRSGCVWLNLGDSFAGSWGAQGHRETPATISRNQINNHPKRASLTGAIRQDGLKPKDLMGVPWAVAFALRADGWWLRRDVIWSKPNPMPESVTDRPTSSHEYLFLLTKSERYFYDADAVREAALPESFKSDRPETTGAAIKSAYGYNGIARTTPQGRTCGVHPNGRNLRSVWTIATQPYPEAHFATFPEELARRCIAAGSSEHGVCSECGAPWVRVVESNGSNAGNERIEVPSVPGLVVGSAYDRVRHLDGKNYQHIRRATGGWQPTCAHNRDPVPATILDPFAGSGTTLAVARRMGRRAVGIELQANYLPLIQRRVSEGALPLLELLTAGEH